MPTSVFLNGKFFTLDAATPESRRAALSPFDAGFQHGVGLFETMLGGVSENGDGAVWCMRIDEHLARLAASAKELGLSETLRAGALADAIAETVRQSGLARARIRLTVSGGDLNLLTRASAGGGAKVEHDPTILIVAQQAVDYPAGMFERGVAVSIADARANPFSPMEGHKTLNYWWRLRELQAASAKNAAEALVLSVSNHLVGGCVSNVLLVSGDEILTPIARGEEGGGRAPGEQHAGADDPDAPPVPVPTVKGGYLPSPVLPGVVRAWALDWAADQGMAVKRQMLSVADVLEADEVLLTNSSWGVLPVVRIEGSAVGAGDEGAVGPIGRKLAAAWRGLVEEYAGGGAR